jgi:hypothetical protein
MKFTATVTGFGHTTIDNDTGLEVITVAGGQDLKAHNKVVNIIVAAPDLLEACEEAFRFLDCDPEEATIQWADQLFEQLRKAITKAKGEQ